MAPNSSCSPIIKAIYNPRSRPSARVERWTLRLQPYDFKIVYIPGQQNVADSLSRLLPPHPSSVHHHGADEYVQFVTHAAVPNAMSLSEVEEATRQDDELTEVKQAIQSGRFEKCKSYMPVAGELCISSPLVLRGTRIVLPSKLRPQVAVSLGAVRLSSLQKINFSETWHTKRVSYTTNKNGKFFFKYSLPAFLEARTHFGTNQAIFHPF